MRSQRLFSTENGVITLEDIPYAETRTEPSQFTSDRKNWGISAYYEDEPGRELMIFQLLKVLLFILILDIIIEQFWLIIMLHMTE